MSLEPEHRNISRSYSGLKKIVKRLHSESPKISVTTLLTLIEVIENQGASPAEISELINGDRDSSAIQGAIKKLEKMALVQTQHTEYKNGANPRKLVWVTDSLVDITG